MCLAAEARPFRLHIAQTPLEIFLEAKCIGRTQQTCSSPAIVQMAFPLNVMLRSSYLLSSCSLRVVDNMSSFSSADMIMIDSKSDRLQQYIIVQPLLASAALSSSSAASLLLDRLFNPDIQTPKAGAWGRFELAYEVLARSGDQDYYTAGLVDAGRLIFNRRAPDLEFLCPECPWQTLLGILELPEPCMWGLHHRSSISRM